MKDYATADRQQIIAGRRPAAARAFRHLIEQGCPEVEAANLTRWHPARDAVPSARGIVWYVVLILSIILMGSLYAISEANAAELRVEHTSKITKRATTHTTGTRSWRDCVKSANLIRQSSIGHIRAWCDGRRV